MLKIPRPAIFKVGSSCCFTVECILSRVATISDDGVGDDIVEYIWNISWLHRDMKFILSVEGILLSST